MLVWAEWGWISNINHFGGDGKSCAFSMGKNSRLKLHNKHRFYLLPLLFCSCKGVTLQARNQ
jgi:hypothetical protein